MSAALRVLLVDDEPLARTHLRALLAAEPDVEILGECGDGASAVRAIRETQPDLVLLDIQMPEGDGFAVVREVGPDRMPPVIFVTAYDEHAIRAFTVHALAYLLKPVEGPRLHDELARVRAHRRRDAEAELVARLEGLLGEGTVPSPDRLAVKVDGRILFLETRDIDWAEGADNHVRLHLGPRTHLVRGTLTELARRLPTGRFLRVHRSALVNVARIVEVQPWFGGDFVVILAGGRRITTGRSYRSQVQDFLRRSM